MKKLDYLQKYIDKPKKRNYKEMIQNDEKVETGEEADFI